MINGSIKRYFGFGCHASDNGRGRTMDRLPNQTGSRFIWRSTVGQSLPELGMVMHNNPLLDSLQSTMRIKQILGLRPQQEYAYIVQFWVPASKLVRPTPDPDVHNHYSTVTFPDQVDPMHKQWIEKMRKTPASQRPRLWTQMGYTYDWGNLYTEIGVSEFVVKPGTTIKIDQLATIWYWYSQQVDLTAADVK